MLRFFKSLLAGGCLVAASSVSATPITEPEQLIGPLTFIDFNNVTTVPSNGILTLSGVTITGVTSLISVDRFTASTRYPTYVGGNAIGAPDGNPAPPNFRITFDNLVSQVGFGLFDTNFTNPPTFINVFDKNGLLLESTSPDALFQPGGSGADYVGFVRSDADISFLEIVAATQGSSLDLLWIDNLSFRTTPVSVPAPASILLMISFTLLAARKWFQK